MRTGVDGEALHKARFAMGLTQHQLARIVDVAGGERISGWERGENEPRARVIPELAQALGVDPLELLALPNGVDLRALRLAVGRTAPELARALNVSLHSYLRWEAGQRLTLPMGDQRILTALSRELRVPTLQILEALHRSGGHTSPSA